METKTWLKIGEVAKRTGLSHDALRFYEERGLLPEAARTEGKFRLFPPETVERLGFVQRAKNLGFSLDEITQLLNLRQSPATDSHQVLELVEQHIREVDHRIAELANLRQALVQLADTCDGSHPTSDCPILQFFAQSEKKECCHGTR